MFKQRLIIIVLITLVSSRLCSAQNIDNSFFADLRDSLDSIQYPILQMPSINNWKVITIKTQEQWDNLADILQSQIKNGEQNIEIRIKGNGIEFGKVKKEIQVLNYPKVNIRIVGTKAKVQPYGFTFKKCNTDAILDNGFYSLPYTEFDINDIVIDKKGNEIIFREETKQVLGDIIKVQGGNSTKVQDDVWKFEVDLPDLSEDQCKDFYVLMTRDWTSARHSVIKVQDGWLYYHLDSEDLHSDRNPNVDWTQYRVRPRYTLINNPVSKGLHIVGGRIYVPTKYKQVRVNKGGQLITFAYCHFNSLEITGFQLNGCGGNGTPIGLYSCTLNQGAFIHHNTFTNISSLSISTANNENVVIADNTIANTREQAIAGRGINTTIARNYLRNIGWMLNTRAITGGGDSLHICDNVIEDFNYSAIAVGSRAPTRDSVVLNYIIERNVVRLTKKFTENYVAKSLADGGGIYTGPQCTRGIIRNNVIENIKGIHSNRGIFLDDGSKNLAIYGNLIIGTANSYDIDLRLSREFEKDIPDHNTRNSIFDNILTGGYRFQDAGKGSRCIGGQNVLLGTGAFQKSVVDVNDVTKDLNRIGEIKMDKLIQLFVNDYQLINTQ